MLLGHQIEAVHDWISVRLPLAGSHGTEPGQASQGNRETRFSGVSLW
jgi:hypothetical protein